jgi:hypothetical protein
MDGLAFMASSIIGSKGMGALGKTAGIAKLEGQLASRTASRLAAGETTGIYQTLDWLGKNSNMERSLMTAYSTISEAGTEAYGVNKELKEELTQMREMGRQGIKGYESFKDMSDEDIKLKAGDAAAKTFA